METSEKMNDIVYIRNIERDRLKEEEIKLTIKKSKTEEQYWSPLLAESKNDDPVQSGVRSSPSRPQRPSPIPRTQTPKPVTPTEPSVDQDIEVIKEILQKNPPKGMKRVNIIIGRRLYAPSHKTSEVFGETIETETWDVVPNLPKEIINFTTKQIRVYTDKTTGMIKATGSFLILHII